MLVHQTIGKLEALGLAAMAAGLAEQLEAPGTYDALGFADRLGLLVDRESDARDSRRIATRTKAAKLRHQAVLEDVDFRSPRGLDRSVVLALAEARFVASHHNVVITGATGCGKSYLACALAHSAIGRGHTALYVRTPRLSTISRSGEEMAATAGSSRASSGCRCSSSTTSCSLLPGSRPAATCSR